MKVTRTLLFIVSVIIVVVVALIVFFSVQPTTPPSQPTVVIPTQIPGQNNPKGERIIVSGVSVKNPYTAPVQLTTQGDSLMTQAPTFQLVYLKQFDEFLISITASPFDINRKLAETAFLTRLGITQEQACKLKVTITTPVSVNPNQAGQKYPLSFCQ